MTGDETTDLIIGTLDAAKGAVERIEELARLAHVRVEALEDSVADLTERTARQSEVIRALANLFSDVPVNKTMQRLAEMEDG